MIIVCCSLLLQVVWPFFPSEVSVKANSRVASVLSLLAMTRSQVGEIRHVLMVQVPLRCSDRLGASQTKALHDGLYSRYGSSGATSVALQARFDGKLWKLI
ncbi:hypothetical protein V8E55_001530 [Tylopilus felleus]